MSLEMKIPTVGESITEVVVAGWMKQDGDYVEMDDVLCELESDKATFELNAEAAGSGSVAGLLHDRDGFIPLEWGVSRDQFGKRHFS